MEIAPIKNVVPHIHRKTAL